MPIPGQSVMQVTWVGRIFGQQIRHVRHWGYVSNGPVQDDLYGIAYQFAGIVGPGGSADFTTSYLNCLSSNYTLEAIVAKVLWPQQGRYAEINPAGPLVGGRTAAITGNLQAGIHANTALGGRKQVASYKIGPMATTDSVAGMTSAGLKAALATYAGTFTLAVPQPLPNLIAWVPCIFHRGKKISPGVYAESSWDKIIASVYEDEVRVKGTRTIGRGE